MDTRSTRVIEVLSARAIWTDCPERYPLGDNHQTFGAFYTVNALPLLELPGSDASAVPQDVWDSLCYDCQNGDFVDSEYISPPLIIADLTNGIHIASDAHLLRISAELDMPITIDFRVFAGLQAVPFPTRNIRPDLAGNESLDAWLWLSTGVISYHNKGEQPKDFRISTLPTNWGFFEEQS